MRHFIEIKQTVYRLLISRRIDICLTGVSHAVTVQFVQPARYAFLDRHFDCSGTISDRAFAHTPKKRDSYIIKCLPLWCRRMRFAVVHRNQVRGIGAFPSRKRRVLGAHPCEHPSRLYSPDRVGRHGAQLAAPDVFSLVFNYHFLEEVVLFR